MNTPQLPLFDWHTTVMGEGYRRLAAFRFDEAEEHFRDVLLAEQGEEEEDNINKALHACTYWKALLEQGKENPGAYPADKLYGEVRRYGFGNIPGLHQLKNALLEYIAEHLVSGDHFYINGTDGETVSDLLMELRHYKKAEKIVLHRIEDQPGDAQLRYVLAQIQWLNKQKGGAKKNYARGLLYNPGRPPLRRILYEQLITLIEDVGAEMAPAFGWVRGVLPLIVVPENLEICSEKHQRAVDCYRLLRAADKALRNRDYEACYRYRKKLKTEAPGLYDEYFALLSGKA